MKSNNNTVSKVLGFVALAFGIISIPMLFLPLLTLDFVLFETSGGNIITFFNGFYPIALPILLIVMEVIALVGAIFNAIPKKALKILGSIFLTLSFVASLAFIIYIYVQEFTPGVGLWIIMSCLLVAAILSIISAVKFKKQVPEMINDQYYEDEGNYDHYPQQEGNISFYGGNCAGYNIPIKSGTEVLIGKDPAICQIVIDRKYGKVSRKHCGVMYDAMNGVYMVTDYSSNGTFVVNGQRLPSNQVAYLEAGTTLNLAKTENAFRLG